MTLAPAQCLLCRPGMSRQALGATSAGVWMAPGAADWPPSSAMPTVHTTAGLLPACLANRVSYWLGATAGAPLSAVPPILPYLARAAEPGRHGRPADRAEPRGGHRQLGVPGGRPPGLPGAAAAGGNMFQKKKQSASARAKSAGESVHLSCADNRFT